MTGIKYVKNAFIFQKTIEKCRDYVWKFGKAVMTTNKIYYENSDL